VGRNLTSGKISGGRLVETAKREILIQLFPEVSLGEGITSLDEEGSPEHLQVLTIEDVLGSHEVLSVGLPRLIKGKLPGEFLPT